MLGLMKIEDLSETNVLSFFLEQRHTFFEMVVIAFCGAHYKVLAWNDDGSPIKIKIGQLNIVGNFTASENIPSLGELESVGIIEGGVILEGDFGDVTIHATNIEVKQA